MKAAALGVLGSLVWCCGSVGGPQPQGRSGLELRLEIAKPAFILHESLLVTVAIRNTGAAVEEVPTVADTGNESLHYELTGASFTEPFRFTYGSGAGMRIPGPPPTEALAPGKQLRTPIAIEQYWTGWKPGKHSLRAILDTSAGPVTSNSVGFTIEPPEILSAEAMVDLDGRATGFMRVEFLARTPSGPRLYQAFFSEPQLDAVERPSADFKEAVAAPAEAARVLAPWANFTRSEVFFARFGWESGNAIGMEEDPEAKSSGRLASGGMRWARPALMARDGDVDVFGWQGRRLTVGRIPREGKPAHIVASGELPGIPVACRATLGPESLGSRRVAVAVLADAGGMSLVLAELLQDRLSVTTERFAGLAPIAGSEPDVTLTPRDEIRASVIASDGKDPRQAVLAELIRTPQGSQTKRSALGAFARDVRAASVAYRAPGAEAGPRWAAYLKNGKLVSPGAAPEESAVAGTPLLPLQLIARAAQTYLVVRDAEKGLGILRVP